MVGGIGRFALHARRRNNVLDVDLVLVEAHLEHLHHGRLVFSFAASVEQFSVAVAPILVVPEMAVDRIPGIAGLFEIALAWFVDKMAPRLFTVA